MQNIQLSLEKVSRDTNDCFIFIFDLIIESKPAKLKVDYWKNRDLFQLTQIGGEKKVDEQLGQVFKLIVDKIRESLENKND